MDKSIFQIKHTRYHIFGWTLLFLISVIVLSNFVTFQYALLHALVNSFFLVILFYLNTQILIKNYFENAKLIQYVTFICLAGIITILIRLLITNQFDLEPLTTIINPKYRFLAYIIVTTVLAAIFSAFYQLFQNRYEKERLHLQIIAEQKEAQLQFLKGQINPHFLFNTMNNICALSVANSPETTKVILQLSDLLRYIIYETQKEKVSLSNEIIHIEKFIALFQIRYQTKKDIIFNIKGLKSNNFLIEPMVLIPLVENCLKHTDFDTNSNASIELNLEISENQIDFQTKNTFNPSDKQKDKVGGVGLVNIKKRLKMTYPNKHTFTVNEDKFLYETNLKITI